MYILAWKEGHHLVHHIVEESDDAVVAGTEYGTRWPVGSELDGVGGVVAGASQVGIGLEDGAAVARNVNFGYYLDVAFGGEGHHFGYLLLGVVAAVGALLARTGGVGLAPGLVVAVHTPRAHIVEQRILGNLDAPSVVVGEVPMELVHLELSHQLQMLLDLRYGEEMTRHVEMGASPGETGVVAYVASREGDAAIAHVGYVLGHHLDESLHAVEQATLAVGRDDDGILVDIEGVALVAQLGVVGLVDHKPQAVALWFAHQHRVEVPLAQHARQIFHRGVVLAYVDGIALGGGGEGERALVHLQLHGLRDDGIVVERYFLAARLENHRQNKHKDSNIYSF